MKNGKNYFQCACENISLQLAIIVWNTSRMLMSIEETKQKPCLYAFWLVTCTRPVAVHEIPQDFFEIY